MSGYADYKFLQIVVADRVATVTLNRPEARNAASRALQAELRSVWPALAADRAVNAILLTGAGDYFCVGGDAKEMGRPGGDYSGAEILDVTESQAIITGLLELDKPIVCAINGDAIGLGASIALLCDISVAAEDARIGDPHVKMGLVAGYGGIIIWPLLLGFNRAKEFLMRGTLFKATEAERMGLVNYAVPRAEVLTKAREITQELADGATWAIRWTKLSINKILKERANLTDITSLALEQLTMKMDDHKEAALAFREKRKPKFTGR